MSFIAQGQGAMLQVFLLALFLVDVLLVRLTPDPEPEKLRGKKEKDFIRFHVESACSHFYKYG